MKTHRNINPHTYTNISTGFVHKFLDMGKLNILG